MLLEIFYLLDEKRGHQSHREGLDLISQALEKLLVSGNLSFGLEIQGVCAVENQ
jgi:hypothetical protein